MKKFVKASLSLCTALLLTNTAFASPTRTATQTLYTTEGDDYMDVLNFSNVEFDKLFLNIDAGTTYLYAGAAWNLSDDLYMAAEFNGPLFEAVSNNRTDVTTTQTEGTGMEAGTVGQTDKEIEKNTNSRINESSNTISILTGIGDIGIKLKYNQNGSANKYNKKNGADNNEPGEITYYSSSPDGSQATIEKKNSKNHSMTYSPEVELGYHFDDSTFKVGLGTDIIDKTSFSNTKTYLWYNNEAKDLISERNEKTINDSKIDIMPSFGYSASGFTFSYNGNYYLRGKPVTDVFGNKIKNKYYSSNRFSTATEIQTNGTVKTTKENQLSYKTKYIENAHNVDLSYKKDYDLNEKLNVAWKLGSEVDFGFKSMSGDSLLQTKIETFDYTNAIPAATTGRYTTEIKTTDDQPSTTLTRTMNLSVTPRLNLGAKYAISDSVHFNLGFNCSGQVFKTEREISTQTTGNSISRRTTETTYNDGSKETTVVVPNKTTDTKKEYSYQNYFWNYISTNASCGFTFDLSQNMKLDTALTWTGYTRLTNIYGFIAATVKF